MKRDLEKHRAWQRRSKPLRRTGGPKRTRLKARGKKAKQRHEEAFGEQADLCRRLPCETCLAVKHGAVAEGDVTERVQADLIDWAQRGGHSVRVSDPQHIPCRPIGKDADTGPMCRAHHEEWHFKFGARAFAERYRYDPKAIRTGLAAWMAEQREQRAGC